MKGSPCSRTKRVLCEEKNKQKQTRNRACWLIGKSSPPIGPKTEITHGKVASWTPPTTCLVFTDHLEPRQERRGQTEREREREREREAEREVVGSEVSGACGVWTFEDERGFEAEIGSRGNAGVRRARPCFPPNTATPEYGEHQLW